MAGNSAHRRRGEQAFGYQASDDKRNGIARPGPELDLEAPLQVTARGPRAAELRDVDEEVVAEGREARVDRELLDGIERNIGTIGATIQPAGLDVAEGQMRMEARATRRNAG